MLHKLTLASMSIPIQCVARVATADEATNGVCTVVVTPSIVSSTLINIYLCNNMKLHLAITLKCTKDSMVKQQQKQQQKQKQIFVCCCCCFCFKQQMGQFVQHDNFKSSW